MNHRVASAGKTVEYRLSNQLTPDVKNMIGITGDPTRADYGFGVGLAVRKYMLVRRGILSSPAMRKPAPAFSKESRSDVDYLLNRLARRDPRVKLLAA